MLKFTIKQPDLVAAAEAVHPVVPPRSTLPALQNILIEADEKTLRFAANNLDLGVRIIVQADITGTGAFTAPAKKLLELAKTIPADAAIIIEQKDTRLIVKAGRSEFKLNGMPADEFPSMPVIDWGAASQLRAVHLKTMIARTTFATSTEESRPILNGAFWHNVEGEMRMVATNGHRLARMIIRLDAPNRLTRNFIIHPSALGQVKNIFPDDATVHVAASENAIGFHDGAHEVIARLIEGPYPNYDQVIPKDNDRVLITDRKALTAAVKRMDVVANQQTHRIRLSIGGDNLRFSVISPDVGEATEDLPIQFTGEPLDIGFNATYLLEVLKYADGDTVRMTFKSPERAATLENAEPAEAAPQWSGVIMPLRLSDVD